jgi:hypothetical protein
MSTLSCTPGTVASPLIQAASSLLLTPMRLASSSGPSKALALTINLWAVFSDTPAIYQCVWRLPRPDFTFGLLILHVKAADVT